MKLLTIGGKEVYATTIQIDKDLGDMVLAFLETHEQQSGSKRKRRNCTHAHAVNLAFAALFMLCPKFANDYVSANPNSSELTSLLNSLYSETEHGQNNK